MENGDAATIGIHLGRRLQRGLDSSSTLCPGTSWTQKKISHLIYFSWQRSELINPEKQFLHTFLTLHQINFYPTYYSSLNNLSNLHFRLLFHPGQESPTHRRPTSLPHPLHAHQQRLHIRYRYFPFLCYSFHKILFTCSISPILHWYHTKISAI